MRGLGVLKPLIAVLTSIMPDHMNRYRTMEEYVADKRLIYADQDPNCYTICNADENWEDPLPQRLAAKSYGTQIGSHAYREHGSKTALLAADCILPIIARI